MVCRFYRMSAIQSKTGIDKYYLSSNLRWHVRNRYGSIGIVLSYLVGQLDIKPPLKGFEESIPFQIVRLISPYLAKENETAFVGLAAEAIDKPVQKHSHGQAARILSAHSKFHKTLRHFLVCLAGNVSMVPKLAT